MLGAGEPAAVVDQPRDSVRRLGKPAAPWRIDLVVDINCAHCADMFSSSLVALQPSIDAETIEVVVRWWPRPRDPEANDLIAHLLATAQPQEFRLLSSLVVGTPAGRGWQFLRPRLSELVEPTAIEQRLAANRTDIARIMQEDGAQIARWSLTSVPVLILSDRTGAVRGRWEGKAFAVEPAVRLLTTGARSTDPQADAQRP